MVCRSFNRTFMELKEIRRSVGRLSGAGFNRTFMELKVALRTFKGITSSVSIAPLWN